MAEGNSYYKPNTSKRRAAAEHNEVYHVVIFPSDNSFSVVKSKQCSPAEQDGFVLVQAGSRKYAGFIFETGEMTSDNRYRSKQFILI
jgi:hypothetical protein